MLLLGIDIGTSSIKVSVLDAASKNCLASAQYPESESAVIVQKPGWAEQDPDMWWEHTRQAILKLHHSKQYDPLDIGAIGIAYQMHGLVCVDKQQQVLRNSIIWCDSRAVEIGNMALHKIGEETCHTHLLNSPGNFTASKLAWVKENEPKVFEQIDCFMLPGDFISMKLTGEISCSISSLSEGVFWDFKSDKLSDAVFDCYQYSKDLVPAIRPVFAEHGRLDPEVAKSLSLRKNVPVTYKAGDQPNNALSLNVFEPGEVAATAGTSGVIYAVSDKLVCDRESRINSFAHVNHQPGQTRLGVLLCINGVGILNRWIRQLLGTSRSYRQMNAMARSIAPGSEGLIILPFGNGAERMLNNRTIEAHFLQIDLNKHGHAHMYRAVQEGIAFAFRYGMEIMKDNGIRPSLIRAGKSNMFLSDVFTDSFVNATGVPVELYDCDGSVGAAIGAGIGEGFYKTTQEAFEHFKPLTWVEPSMEKKYDDLYAAWLDALFKQLA